MAEGRHSSSENEKYEDERRRQVALELAVATFQSAQGLDTNHTRSLITRAQAFEDYIAGG